MEFTKKQIASLVLGYLRNEKCSTTYNRYLEESRYFQENLESVKKGKHFLVTRVAGLSLEDFLKEYAEIYSIIQGRIELSNYYNENDARSGSLVQKLNYLLDNSGVSQVETTPVHSLPGNKSNDELSPHKLKNKKHSKILKKKSPSPSDDSSSNSNDELDSVDVSEMISQTLLENPELHVKLAETINNVLHTSADGRIANENKEFDELIKTVVQRTEEEPIFNKLLDEIFDVELPANNDEPISETQTETSDDNQRANRERQISTLTSQVRTLTSQTGALTSQTCTLTSQTGILSTQTSSITSQIGSITPKANNDIYLFDGNLDSYLKVHNAPVVTQNSLLLGGNLIVMPPVSSTSTISTIDPTKQFYVVNSQPMITVPPMQQRAITEKDIMAMPTIIINEDVSNRERVNFPAKKKGRPPKTKIIPCEPPKNKPSGDCSFVADEFLIFQKNPTTNEPKTVEKKPIEKMDEMKTPFDLINTINTDEVTPKSSSSSHVRNLDFSTPLSAELTKPIAENEIKTSTPYPLNNTGGGSGKDETDESIKKNKGETSWDAELRKMAVVEGEHAPCPKQTKARSEKKKVETKKSKTPAKEVVKTTLKTPLKDNNIPKTPGLSHYSILTPFSNVIEEQLRGVDLSTLSTPKLPITPGFSDSLLAPYNTRSTDYSTSSSYYQPSDNEQQNKSIEQMLEEAKKTEKPSRNSEVKILENVVIEPEKKKGKPEGKEKKEKEEKGKEEKEKDEKEKDEKEIMEKEEKQKEEKENKEEEEKEKINYRETLVKFNKHIIGKKNLSLVRKDLETSSSSSDESCDIETPIFLDQESNSTVIHVIGKTIEIETTKMPETRETRNAKETKATKEMKVTKEINSTKETQSTKETKAKKEIKATVETRETKGRRNTNEPKEDIRRTKMISMNEQPRSGKVKRGRGRPPGRSSKKRKALSSSSDDSSDNETTPIKQSVDQERDPEKKNVNKNIFEKLEEVRQRTIKCLTGNSDSVPKRGRGRPPGSTSKRTQLIFTPQKKPITRNTVEVTAKIEEKKVKNEKTSKENKEVEKHDKIKKDDYKEKHVKKREKLDRSINEKSEEKTEKSKDRKSREKNDGNKNKKDVRARSEHKEKDKIKDKKEEEKRESRKKEDKKQENDETNESDEEEIEDQEAQKLVKGLEEMGIFLMPNKSPVKQTKPIQKQPEPPKEKKEMRKFEHKVFTDEIRFTYDENKNSSRQMPDYSFDILDRTLRANVLVEETNKEVIRNIKWTTFNLLADFKSEINVLIPRKSNEGRKNEENKDEEESKETNTGVKRKLETDQSPEPGKKLKRVSVELLKSCDIESLLNAVHGET